MKCAVGIDLEHFFDTVNQNYLIELLSYIIKDGRVISFIHRYLYAVVMVNGAYQPTTERTPQGGSLCPLLSNIVFNERDKELERRGYPFVRYANDSLFSVRVNGKRKESVKVLRSLSRRNFI